jgi:protein-tyrosine phosphatase
LSMEFTHIPFDFHGKIFRSAMPFSSYDPDGQLIHAYKNKKIKVVVMLTGEEESLKITGRNLKEEYKVQGFDVVCLPISDFGVPKVSAMRKIISQVTVYSQRGSNIAVHCHAGVGRTGMFMACLAKIGMGLPAKDSIRWVRGFIPGAIEVYEQEKLVRNV